MRDILKQNKLFLSLFAVYFVVLFALVMYNQHGDGVLFFAKHRTELANNFFVFMSKVGEGAGYVFCFVLLLVIGFRWIDSLAFIITGLLVAGITYFAKDFFSRTRPLPYLNSLKLGDQLNLIEGVYVYVAPTSFPSGHTTSGFALFALLAFFTWKKPVLVILFFITAMMIAISRVYMVQHFLVDILGGSTLGVAIALFVKYLLHRIHLPKSHWLNKRLTSQRHF